MIPAPHPSAPILWLPDLSTPAAASPFPAHPAASQSGHSMSQPALFAPLAPPSLLPHGYHILPGALVSLAKLTIPVLVPLDSLKNLPLIPNFENFIQKTGSARKEYKVFICDLAFLLPVISLYGRCPSLSPFPKVRIAYGLETHILQNAPDPMPQGQDWALHL